MIRRHRGSGSSILLHLTDMCASSLGSQAMARHDSIQSPLETKKEKIVKNEKSRKPLKLGKRQIGAGIKVPDESLEIPLHKLAKEMKNYVRDSRKAAIITRHGKQLRVLLPLPE